MFTASKTPPSQKRATDIANDRYSGDARGKDRARYNAARFTGDNSLSTSRTAAPSRNAETPPDEADSEEPTLEQTPQSPPGDDLASPANGHRKGRSKGITFGNQVAQVNAPPNQPGPPPSGLTKPAIPSSKAAFANRPENRGAWDKMYQGVSTLKTVSQDEINAYMMTFALEGFLTNDGTTVSGITQKTLGLLANNHPELGHLKGKTSKQIGMQDRALIYRFMAKEVLETQGGETYLSTLNAGGLGNAIFDTIIRSGESSATRHIQNAINAATNLNITVDGSFGTQTRKALDHIMQSPHSLKAFRQALYAERSKQYPGEQARFALFL